MLYQKGKVQNGQLVITESQKIDQSKLTSDCWLIQFSGIVACSTCEYRDTPECGGGEVLKKLRA